MIRASRLPAWVTSWWVPLAVFAAEALAFLAYSPVIRTEFPLDDAWIHRVYARALAWGQGLAYNDGNLQAGATSPLWTVLTAPAQWLEPFAGTAAVVLAVKLFGAALAAAAIAACWFAARRVFDSPAAATIAAGLLAVEPRLIVAALSGMELPLLIALWLGLVWAAVERRFVLALVLLGLTPVTRPESIVLFPPALWSIAALARGGPAPWRRPTVWIALSLPSAIWVAYCRAVAGHWLPTTYYVKSTPFHLDATSVVDGVRAMTQSGWPAQLVFWIGLLAWAVWLARLRGARALCLALLTVVAPALFVAGVIGSRDFRLDGYYWTRWVDPPIVVLVAASALGLAALLTGRLFPVDRRRGPRFGPATIAAVSIVAGALLVRGALGVGRDQHLRRDRLVSDSRAILRLNVAAGKWIHDHLPADAVVAVNDAGALRYFGERETLDLLGLNDSDIAFNRTSVQQLIDRIDYLAIFPSWFGNAPFLALFETVQEFRVPPEQYTICDCPGQSVMIIAVKRSQR